MASTAKRKASGGNEVGRAAKQAANSGQTMAESVDAVAVFSAAGLTAAERVALVQTLRGRDLRDVASDSEMVAAYGRQPSHQTVANFLRRAGVKLGVRVQDAVADAQAAERRDRALVYAERAGRVALPELRHDEGRQFRRKAKRCADAAARLETLTDRLLHEAERCGGKLNANRLKHYARAAGRIAASDE